METKQKRLDQIQSELDKLFEERYNIQKQIAEERKSENLARVKSWNITDKSCLILFAKQPCGYHWYIAKTIAVREIDFTNEYIDSIEATYSEADYEYFVRIEEHSIPFTALEQIEKEFNIYFVDQDQLTLLQQHFCNLKLDYKNYKEYEEEVSKNASMSIKISV